MADGAAVLLVDGDVAQIWVGVFDARGAGVDKLTVLAGARDRIPNSTIPGRSHSARYQRQGLPPAVEVGAASARPKWRRAHVSAPRPSLAILIGKHLKAGENSDCSAESRLDTA